MTFGSVGLKCGHRVPPDSEGGGMCHRAAVTRAGILSSILRPVSAVLQSEDREELQVTLDGARGEGRIVISRQDEVRVSTVTYSVMLLQAPALAIVLWL